MYSKFYDFGKKCPNENGIIDNMEDAIIVNQSSVDRGLFRSFFSRTYTDVETKSMNQEQLFGNPEKKMSNIDKDGLLKVGSKVIENDPIICKVGTEKNTKPFYENVRHGEGGVCTKVMLSTNHEGSRIAKVEITNTRIPQMGDKLASLMAQKGTIGMLFRSEDMPFEPISGMTPDILINSHCLVGETTILTDDGPMYIRDFVNEKIRPNVKEWNFDDGLERIVGTNSHFEKSPFEVVKITTWIGDTIRCTPDHPFLVCDSTNQKFVWKQAQELKKNKDKLVMIYGATTILSTTDGILPNLSSAISVSCSSHLSSSVSSHLSSSVSSPNSNHNSSNLSSSFSCLSLCDISSSNSSNSNSYIDPVPSHSKTLILSRMLGALHFNGCVVKRDNKYLAYFQFRSLSDFESLRNDCQKLGFFCPQDRPVSFGFIRHHTIVLDPCLSHYLVVLGADVSEKLHFQTHVHTIPKWMMTAPSSIKREYLSGMGCFLSKFKSSHRKDQVFMEQICSLCLNIGILMCVKKTGHYSCFSIDQSHGNISYFFHTLDFKYQSIYRFGFQRDVVYQLFIQNNKRMDWESFYQLFCSPVPAPSILMFIKSIEPCKETCSVYDFQTISQHHNFIANNFVVHNCIPSRMTIAQLLECMVSKIGASSGKICNATTFSGIEVESVQKQLHNLGFEQHGNETLLSGFTGKPLKAQIFMGPIFYQRLRHMVDDKLHVRSRGQVEIMQHQPLSGRSRNGGLRIGEIFRSQNL